MSESNSKKEDKLQNTKVQKGGVPQSQGPVTGWEPSKTKMKRKWIYELKKQRAPHSKQEMNRGLLADKPVPDTATNYPPHFAQHC